MDHVQNGVSVYYHTGHPPDYFEEIPSDGTQVCRGFRLIPAGKYSITVQVKSLEKLLRHRSVFWGMHCSALPVTAPEDDLIAGANGVAYGCLSEKQPVQSAIFYLPSPKTWYLTLTASNSMRKTRIAAFLYRLPDDPVPAMPAVLSNSAAESKHAHDKPVDNNANSASIFSSNVVSTNPATHDSHEDACATTSKVVEQSHSPPPPKEHVSLTSSLENSTSASSSEHPTSPSLQHSSPSPTVSAPTTTVPTTTNGSYPSPTIAHHLPSGDSITALPYAGSSHISLISSPLHHQQQQQQIMQHQQQIMQQHQQQQQQQQPHWNGSSTQFQSSPSQPQFNFASNVIWPKQGDHIYSPTSGMSYTLVSTLGEGSFGVAMLGSDLYGQPYVLKAAKPFKAQAEIETDWRKEATLMMSLNHPNVVRLHECFAVNGLFWLVMEQAQGSLSSYLKKLPDQRMPPKMILQVAAQLFAGLEHIHLQGMIHRDLQLDNILYSKASAGPDRLVIKISDFGIAKHLGYPAHSGLPAHTRIGREFDMSPGALMGYATNRSDFYQVGMILFHLYTGAPALSNADGPYYQAIPSGVAQKRACALKTDLGDVIAGLLYVNAHHLPATARHAWALFSSVLHYLSDPEKTST